MPHVAVPEGTFTRLTMRAAALNISVDDLVRPVLDLLAETGTSARSIRVRLPGTLGGRNLRHGSEMPKTGPYYTLQASFSTTVVTLSTATGKTPYFDPA